MKKMILSKINNSIVYEGGGAIQDYQRPMSELSGTISCHIPRYYGVNILMNNISNTFSQVQITRIELALFAWPIHAAFYAN